MGKYLKACCAIINN